MHSWRLVCLAVVFAAQAQAQPGPSRVEIWDLQLGAHDSQLPAHAFTGFACGTNGGPPGAPLSSFADFAACPSDADGLHEVHVRYDDELEYWAKAHASDYWIERFTGTKIVGYQVILSLLFDDNGLMRAVRAVTDPHVDDTARFASHRLGNSLAARFHIEAEDCTDLPRGERETPIGDVFVKRRCQTPIDEDRFVILETRLYRRPGQAQFDAHSRRITEGQFESSARLEIRLSDAAADRIAAQRERPAEIRGASQAGTPEGRLLAGEARDCPGCDLTGANLKRRDLANADLRGAILRNANLHDARLSGANLERADLSEANLNKADLRRASLRAAVMPEAMTYAAQLDAADLTGVDLTGAMMGHARMTGARLDGATLDGADLREARMAATSLRGARMVQTWLDHVQLGRAVLADATIVESSLYQAAMRDTDLAGATIVRSDLFDADLTRADLSDASISSSRLQSAILTDARLDGTTFTATIMPDGTVRE